MWRRTLYPLGSSGGREQFFSQLSAASGASKKEGRNFLSRRDTPQKKRLPKSQRRRRRSIRNQEASFRSNFANLIPILWSAGAAADVMKRIAAPIVGGIFTSFLLELAVYPAL